MTLLERLKLLLGITGSSEDSRLNVVLMMAEDDFLALTHRAELPTNADSVLLRMAIVRYNLLKDEGLASMSVSGISESYQGYGDNLLQSIRHFRKVVTV